MFLSSTTQAALLALASIVAARPYQEYILAPSSRTVHPASVYNVNGTVAESGSITGGATGSANFQGVSAVTYDFGKNTAGLVSFEVGNLDAGRYIGLTYTESSLWISSEGSDATQDSGIDEVLWFQPSGPGNYSVDRDHERGGFRYLSLIHNGTGNIEVTGISVYFTPQPHLAEDQLQNYTGYFHCDNELFNRIWYAGAYTNQMVSIDPKHGDSLIHESETNSSVPGDTVAPWVWYLNTTILNGTSALTDGAKRDRSVSSSDSRLLPTVTHHGIVCSCIS